MTKDLQYLLAKATSGNATDEELRQLRMLIDEDESGETAVLCNLHFSGKGNVTDAEVTSSPPWEEIIQRILSVDKGFQPASEVSFEAPIRPIHAFRRWMWAAASILLLLGAATYIWIIPGKKIPGSDFATSIKDVMPGKNGAVLTLQDGSNITLDSLSDGVVTTQSSVTISLSNDRLVYRDDSVAAAAVAYNTVTTPKGRQYQLFLPDGTHVWLNAASSITFPTTFTGNERKIDVTGEAYFEVAKNPLKPFRVKVYDGSLIEVLGTHFNINSYADETTITTTLLEGSVKLYAKDNTQLLAPGQQAKVAPLSSTISLVEKADMLQAVAWKEGLFSFTNAGLETVMKQISRWYDVTVKYDGEVPKREFNGEISRSLTLSQLLYGLGKTRINYSIEEGNTIVIHPE